MPVSRSEFEKGRAEPTSHELVLNYLQSHPDQAYTAVEISNAIKKLPAPAPSAAAFAGFAPLGFVARFWA